MREPDEVSNRRKAVREREKVLQRAMFILNDGCRFNLPAQAGSMPPPPPDGHGQQLRGPLRPQRQQQRRQMDNPAPASVKPADATGGDDFVAPDIGAPGSKANGRASFVSPRSSRRRQSMSLGNKENA